MGGVDFGTAAAGAADDGLGAAGFGDGAFVGTALFDAEFGGIACVALGDSPRAAEGALRAAGADVAACAGDDDGA